MCRIAASTTLCLAVSLSNCDSYVSGKVYALYYSYISIVTLECTDACATQPCANGGTCTRTNTKDGFKCACAAGYGGKRCDTRKDRLMNIFVYSVLACCSRNSFADYRNTAIGSEQVDVSKWNVYYGTIPIIVIFVNVSKC